MGKAGLFRYACSLWALSGAAVAITSSSCADVTVSQEGTPPEIFAIQPAKGPSAGGTPVVITGENFVDGATVRFGGALAADTKWIDEKTIAAVTPPGVGAVSVSVESPTHLVDTIEGAFTYEGSLDGGCAIVASSPKIGASEVPVIGDLHVSFSAPIEAASLQGAVKLQLLGGAEVPADVKLDASTGDVLVTPKKSLRFWGSYAVVVGEGVKSEAGVACAPGAVAFATVKPHALPRALRPAAVSGLALVGSSILTASEGYRGMQTYAFPSAAGVALKSDLTTSFGPRGVVVRGSRAYAPSGFSGVQILDVSSPEAPELLGHGGTPGRANDVAVIEKDGRTFLFVADVAQGVRALDATDPAGVLDLGVFDIGDKSPSAVAIDAQGPRVVVADGSKVVVLDVQDPASPAKATLLATIDVGVGVSDVLLEGARLFVSKTYFGVASYDLSNPAQPALISTAEDPDGPCGPGCLDIAAQLTKDGQDLFCAFGRGGVLKYKVDAAGKLTPSTHYKVPGSVRAVAVTASSVVAGGEEGLLVFDREGDGTTPAWFDPNGHGLARSVAVQGDHAYVGDSLRGLQTFSLAVPEAPEPIDRDDTPGSLTADIAAYGVAVSGGALAVGDGRAGITMFDLSNPANPVLGGTVDTTDSLTSVVQVGSITYGCNGNGGVVAVDSSDIAAPVLIGQIDFSDVKGSDSCAALLPVGDLLYVGRAQGLGVLDIHDPSNLAWKALVQLPSKDAIVSLAAAGGHLLATSSAFDFEGTNNTMSRLRVFDTADPAQPVLVYSSDDLGGPSNVSVVADIAFVAAGGSMKVFDVSDVTSPALEGALGMPGSVLSVAPGAGVLYAAQGAGGLQAIATGPLPKIKAK